MIKELKPYITYFEEQGYTYQPAFVDRLDFPLPATLDLSLIIPIYNSEKLLPRCLDSLAVQETRYDFEVILVDDGSTDNSLAIAQAYAKKNPRFKVLTQENQGIGGARNTGLRQAQGKYVGLIDNDDKVTKDYVQRLLDESEESHYDIVRCSFQVVDPLTEKVSQIKKFDPVASRTPVDIKLFTALPGYVWSGIYKRDLFQDICFPKGYWYEDMIEKNIILRRATSYKRIADCLYLYSMHEENASKKVWGRSTVKGIDQLVLVQEILGLNHQLGLLVDERLQHQVLSELGPFLYNRLKGKNKVIKRQAFGAASVIVKSEIHAMDFQNLRESLLYQSLFKENYYVYRIICCTYNFKDKFGRGIELLMRKD